MTNPVSVSEASVWDGRGNPVPVRAGDKVELLPAIRDYPTGREGVCLSQQNYDFHIRWLGKPGPYEVSSIGRWPCGRHTLYLKKPGGNPGVRAVDFQIAT